MSRMDEFFRVLGESDDDALGSTPLGQMFLLNLVAKNKRSTPRPVIGQPARRKPRPRQEPPRQPAAQASAKKSPKPATPKPKRSDTPPAIDPSEFEGQRFLCVGGRAGFWRRSDRMLRLRSGPVAPWVDLEIVRGLDA